MTVQSYSAVIKEAVRRKWPSDEQKEWWYTKFSAVRRRKCVLLYHRQNGKCYYCSEQTFISSDENNQREDKLPKKRVATLEHMRPQKRGGTDNLANLVMACMGCNSARGIMNFQAFLHLRSDPVRWEAYVRRRAGIRGAPHNTKKHTKKQAKREIRLQRVAWNLALLFYMRPDLKVRFEENVAVLRARHTRILELRLEKAENFR